MSTRFTIGKFPVRNDDDAVLVKPFDSNRGQEYLWESVDITVDPSDWLVQVDPTIIDWVSPDIQVDASQWRVVSTVDISSGISTDADVDPNLGLIVYLETEVETEVEIEGRLVWALDMSTSIETEIDVDPFLRLAVAMSMVVGGVECGVNQNSFAPGFLLDGVSGWMTLAWIDNQLAITNLGPSHKEVRFFEIDKQKLTATLVQTLHWPTSSLQIERSGSGLILGNGASYHYSSIVQSPLQLTELVQDGTGQWVASQTWAPEQPDLPGVVKIQNFQAYGDYLIAIVGLARTPGSLEWIASIYKRVAGSWVLQSSYLVDNSSLTDVDDWIFIDATIFENAASFIVSGWISATSSYAAREVTLIRDPASDSWAVENAEVVLGESIHIEPHNKIWLSDSAFIQYRYEQQAGLWLTRLWQKDGSQFKPERSWEDFISIVQVKPNMLFGYEYNQSGPVYYPSLQVLHRTATGWALRDKLTNPSTLWPFAAASSPDGTVVAWSGHKGGSNPEESYDIIYLTRVGEYGHLLPYGICLNADLTVADTIEMLVEILTSIDLDAALNLKVNLNTEIDTSATISAELDIRTFVDLSTNIQTNITMNPILDIIETEFLEDLQAWAQYGLTGNLKLWKPPSTLRLEDQQAWAQYGLTGRVKLAEPCVCDDPIEKILATEPTHFWWFGGLTYGGVETMRDDQGDPIVDGSTDVYAVRDLVTGSWDMGVWGDAGGSRFADHRVTGGVDGLIIEGLSIADASWVAVVRRKATPTSLGVMLFGTGQTGTVQSQSAFGLTSQQVDGSTAGIRFGASFTDETAYYRWREGSDRYALAIDGEDTSWSVSGTGAATFTGIILRGDEVLADALCIIVYDDGERVGELLDEGLNDLIEDLKTYDPDECHCDEPGPDPEPDPGERELAAHDFSFTKPGLYRTGGTQSRILTQKDFTFAKGGLAPAFDSQTRTLAQQNFSWTKQSMDSFSYPYIRAQGNNVSTLLSKGEDRQFIIPRKTSSGTPHAQCAVFVLHATRQVKFLDEESGVTILKTHGSNDVRNVYVGLVTKILNADNFALNIQAFDDGATTVVLRFLSFNHSASGSASEPDTTSVISGAQTGYNAIIQTGHNTPGWYSLNFAGIVAAPAGLNPKFSSPFNPSMPNSVGWISDGVYGDTALAYGFGQNGGWNWVLGGLTTTEYVVFNVQLRCWAPFIENP